MEYDTGDRSLQRYGVPKLNERGEFGAEATTPEKEKQSKDDKNLKDGTRAWIVCFSAFFLQTCILGILHAFGVFFVAFIEDFKCSKAAAAWVGSGAYGLTMAVSPMASVVINKFGHRVSASIGCVISALALLISSYMPSIGALYGSFTVLFAIGCSLAYTPCMTISTDYFDKHASIATGFIVAGSSFGTLLLSPISQALVNKFGWRNTFRSYTGLTVIGLMCAYQFKPLNPVEKTPVERIKSSMARPMMKELQLWKNKVYIIWIVAIFCVMFGYYIPYVHLISHAIEIGVSPSLGSVLIMTLGGTCSLGRILWGKVLQKGYLDRLRLDQMSMVVTGSFVMILPLFRTFGGILLYVIVVGMLDGCYVVLLPMLTEAFTGTDKKVTAWAVLNSICAVSFTMGPVVAGWIYDATGSYNLSFHVAGIPIIVGAVLMFFIPWAQQTAHTTNAMRAARSSYGIMECNDDDFGTGVMDVQMTDAISIPRIHASRIEQSLPQEVLPLASRGSIVVVDLSNNQVQAFSTSHNNRHVPITDEDKLPDAIAKAMMVLHRTSESIMSLRSKDESLFGCSCRTIDNSADRVEPPSMTPRLVHSQRGAIEAARHGFFVGQPPVGLNMNQTGARNALFGLPNASSVHDAVNPNDVILHVKDKKPTSSHASSDISITPTATSPTSNKMVRIASPEDMSLTPKENSSPQRPSAVFHNADLPTIAEMPTTSTAGESSNMSREQRGAEQSDSNNVEDHAIFQIADLDMSNTEINEEDNDKENRKK